MKLTPKAEGLLTQAEAALAALGLTPQQLVALLEAREAVESADDDEPTTSAQDLPLFFDYQYEPDYDLVGSFIEFDKE